MGTISRAIQTREAGYTLAHSAGFQALLPNDGYTNFSAIFYHNIGPVVGPLAAQLKSSGALTRAAATVGRCAHGKLRAGLDLCLWRAGPDRRGEQYRVHGI